jgi:hypothetical protein
MAFNFFAQEYKLEQSDLEQFLAFADEYKTLAKKFLQNTDNMSMTDMFYADNKKLMSATTNFLKGKKWTYDKMNDFLYLVSCAMDAISFYEEYGYPEEVGADDSDPFKDIPAEAITLVKANRETLAKYFPLTDFSLDYSDTVESEPVPDINPQS